MTLKSSFLRRAAMAAATLLLSGGAAQAGSDPLEGFNRAAFAFNTALVEQVIDPAVATVGPWLPDMAVMALGNAYSNLTEIEFVLNNALAGDFRNSAVSVARFAVNTTVGLAGTMDVAGAFGLQRNERDFAESLCRTGVPPGPYLVLPFVGGTNAVHSATLAGAIALEVYALSFISTALAAADFLVIDLGGSAAALRYATDVGQGAADPYAAKRDEYLTYVTEACGPPPPVASAAAVVPQ